MSAEDGSYKFFFFQAEDGIRELVRSRGLGDVYTRQRERRLGRPAADLPGRALTGRFLERAVCPPGALSFINI